MKKKKLLTIVAMSLIMGTLAGCNKEGLVQFAVTFDTDGGSIVNPVIVKKGEKVSRPSETPSKEGYTFIDWYTAKEGDTKFDFDKTTIVANTTIYAHYKALTDEEKFFIAYKAASDTFQASNKGFDQYDITYKVGDTEITNIEKVYYEVEDNVRECSLKQINSEDETVLAGGTMKYYDDPTKGIRAYIQDFKDSGFTVTFSTDNLYKTCAFTATNGGVSISNTFNSQGYLTKGTLAGEGNVGIDFSITYPGTLHNPCKNVDATFTNDTFTASASNLVHRDLVRVTVEATDDHAIKVIECPNYEIGTYSFNDINVGAIYDSNFTKLNYSIKDGKITLNKTIEAKTIIDLKVAKSEGINSLTINAHK